MDITNSHTAPLTLPNGQTIPARGSVELSSEDWSAMKDNFVVKAWFDEKKLQKGKPEDEDAEDDGDTPEMADLRTRFNEAWAGSQDRIKTLEGEVAQRDDRIADLERQVADAKAAKPSSDGGQGGSDELKAVHRGRGSYSIMRGSEELAEGLSKEDADAFNALTAEQKAAQLQARQQA